MSLRNSINSINEIDHVSGHHYSKTYDRHNVTLKLKNGKYAGMSLARYMWLSQRGDIPEGMVVDHIDNDRNNDTIENLQLLTVGDNNRKYLASKGYVPSVTVFCSKCGAQKEMAQGRYNASARISNLHFCSKACRNKYHAKFPEKYVTLKCPSCHKDFQEMICRYHDRIKRSKSKDLCCSVICSQVKRMFE